MTYEQFKESVISHAQNAGLNEYDLYYQRSVSTTVKAFEGEVDEFSDKTALGACFRCIVDGKTGYSHTQLLNEHEAARLVADSLNCARVLDDTASAKIFDGSNAVYQSVGQSSQQLCDVATLKQIAVDIEKLAKSKDRRIVSVPYAYAAFYYSEVRLCNSKGLDKKNAQSGYTIVCSVVAESDGKKYSGDGFQQDINIDDLDLESVVSEAVYLALGSIGGQNIVSKDYPVIFSRRMMCEMLSAFSPVFSADMAQKGFSLLFGKENSKIASPFVSIVDDPLWPEAVNKTAFDDEGVPTYQKNIIENGVLNTLLYDIKSAEKAGKTSTGNGRKASYAGNITVGTHNIYLQKGAFSLDELLQKADNGIYITELKGLHASANAATGDFSLESKGFLIENAKLSTPVEQFTIAGNFYQLLMDIEAIADDFILEDGVGSAGVFVKKLSVSG